MKQEMRIFGWEDLLWLARREKKRLVRLAFAGFVLGAFFLCYLGASYTVEAFFKEQKEEAGLESRDLVKQLFSASFSPVSTHTQALMKSRAVLRPVIEKLGLQIEEIRWRPFGHLADLVRAECKMSLKELDPFRFADVFYEGEKPLFFTLVFSDETHFSLFEKGKKVLDGDLGEKMILPDRLAFSVQKVSKRLVLGKKYRLRILPWLQVAKSLRKNISIVPQKTSSSLYDLSYKTRDRALGALLLNELMAEFQAYLKKEHDRLAEEQLAYLAKRKSELSLQLELDLQERASHIGEQFREKGFLSVSQQFEVFLEPHSKLMNELFAVERELQLLEKKDVLAGDLPPFLQEKGAKLKNFLQQRDLSEVSILKTSFLSPESSAAIEKELEEIREKKEKIQISLKAWQLGENLSWDPDLLVSAWAEKLNPLDLDEEKRAQIQNYLADRSRLLSFREKILSERLLHKEGFPAEFEGIDWETSRTLCRDYTHRLDEMEMKIRSLTDSLLQILSQDRELGCFSSVLKDPLSERLIASANTLYLQLKESKYCSAKEESRWQEDLQLQKKMLKEHLEQLLEMEKNNVELMREKLSALQQASLSCIHQQISLLKEQIQEEIKERQKELLQEKLRLQKKMEEIRLQFAALPEFWLKEQLFAFKSQAHQKIMEAIVQLVETKTIGHHLHQVGSKSIDLAILPLAPNSPHALVTLLLGSLLLPGIYFSLQFLRSSSKGFPLTAAKLRILDLPFSGPLSRGASYTRLKDLFREDLDTLRTICSFIDVKSSSAVVGLLGQELDFSEHIASLGAQMGRKVCWIDARFSETKKEGFGLLQWLENSSLEPPMIQRGFADYIAPGGYTSFGAEKLQSSAFSSLLENLKGRYDWILLTSSAPLASAESRSFFHICDRIAISLRGEQIDLLTPFISWAYDKECCRLTFIASEIS